MSTAAVTIKDPDLIEIPPDAIQLGFDTDGMPRTDPVDEVPKDEPKAPTLAELEALRREKDETAARLSTEAAARVKAEAEAKQAREATEVLTGKLDTTQKQALGAHYHKAYSDYKAVHSEHQQIVNAISSTETLAASLEQQALAAEEAGDRAKAIRLQREMARAEAHLTQLEAGKTAAAREVEDAKYKFQEAEQLVRTPATEVKPEPKPKAEPEVKTVAEETKPDPDAWIDQWPKKTTGQWLKSHKDYVTDPAKHKQLIDFVQEWYNEGNPVHTKDFVAALNEKFAPEDVEMSEETPKVVETKVPATKTKATPAAPVTRGANTFSSTNLSASTVRLPPKLAAFVKASGLDPTQYALGAVEDIKSGKLPKNFLDPDYDHNF